MEQAELGCSNPDTGAKPLQQSNFYAYSGFSLDVRVENPPSGDANRMELPERLENSG